MYNKRTVWGTCTLMLGCKRGFCSYQGLNVQWVPSFWQSPSRELKIGQRRKQIDAGAPRETLWVRRITPGVPRGAITFFRGCYLPYFLFARRPSPKRSDCLSSSKASDPEIEMPRKVLDFNRIRFAQTFSFLCSSLVKNIYRLFLFH